MNAVNEEMVFDYRKLKGRIVEKFDTLATFAEHIGKKPAQITNKINFGTPFSSASIIEWAEALEIPLEEFGVYFFTLKV